MVASLEPVFDEVSSGPTASTPRAARRLARRSTRTLPRRPIMRMPASLANHCAGNFRGVLLRSSWMRFLSRICMISRS